MRHELQFLSPLVGRDENGSEISTWVASQAIWCNIEYKEAGSKEDSIGARIHSFVNISVTLRYLPGIDAKMKIYADGYEWNINTVLLSHRKDFLTLECVQDKPTTLLEWVTNDGETWVDQNGNAWIFEDPSQTLSNATGISWTDGEGHIWTPKRTL